MISAFCVYHLLTDFIHEPYKTIFVRDLIKVSQDDLLIMMTSLETGSAYWADGILFASFAMTESEELAKKEMEGKTYIEKIVFAKLDTYSKTIKSSTNMEISVLNVQQSKLYAELVAWIKKQPIWK